MATVGRKNKTEVQKSIEGTTRKDRTVEPIVPHVEGSVYCPLWIQKRVAWKKIWDRKMAVYIKRGQSLVGQEELLCTYVLAIYHMEEILKNGELPSVHFINAFRHLANEFFDTPASQYGKMASRPGADNPFRDNKPKPKQVGRERLR